MQSESEIDSIEEFRNIYRIIFKYVRVYVGFYSGEVNQA